MTRSRPGVMNPGRWRGGRSSDSDGRSLHIAGLGQVSGQPAGPRHSTALNAVGRRTPAWARLNRVEGGDSLRTGPSRTMIQDELLEVGHVYMPTDNNSGTLSQRFVSLLYIRIESNQLHTRFLVHSMQKTSDTIARSCGKLSIRSNKFDKSCHARPTVRKIPLERISDHVPTIPALAGPGHWPPGGPLRSFHERESAGPGRARANHTLTRRRARRHQQAPPASRAMRRRMQQRVDRPSTQQRRRGVAHHAREACPPAHTPNPPRHPALEGAAVQHQRTHPCRPGQEYLPPCQPETGWSQQRAGQHGGKGLWWGHSACALEVGRQARPPSQGSAAAPPPAATRRPPTCACAIIRGSA